MQKGKIDYDDLMKNTQKQKISILSVLFVGYVGFSIIFPVLPSMFLDPSLDYLPPEFSLSVRNILLGVMVAMYPLGQFFGCPIFGRLSDTYGRRPILLITIFCTAILYCITALGIELKCMPLAYLGRFLTGIFEGNITIAMAVMSDLSQEKIDKTKNFGWLLTISSTGWIVGPLLGGWLSDSSVVSWFGYSTPFWSSSLLLLCSFFLIYCSFKETLSLEKRRSYVHIRKIFSTFSRLLKRQNLRQVLIANHLFYLSCFIFFVYFGTLIFRWFHTPPRMIGNLEAYISLFICFAPLTYSILANKFSHPKTMAIAGVGLAISLITLILFPYWSAIWITLSFPSYFIALGMSFSSLLVSDYASATEQGEALGLNTACMVLAEAFVGLFGGFLIAIWLYLPYSIGIFLALTSAYLIISQKKLSQ